MELEMKYFVLKPHGTDAAARASRNALRAYSQTMRSEGERDFANSLMDWVEREAREADNALGNPYGVCPHCGGVVQERERRLNGNDTCENGHVYPSRLSQQVR